MSIIMLNSRCRVLVPEDCSKVIRMQYRYRVWGLFSVWRNVEFAYSRDAVDICHVIDRLRDHATISRNDRNIERILKFSISRYVNGDSR